MFNLNPIIDNYCDPPHIDGYEVLLEEERIAVFWACKKNSIEMLKKLNNQPSTFSTKLRLEPLNDPKHFFLIERGNNHILWGEIFLEFDEALNILGKLND